MIGITQVTMSGIQSAKAERASLVANPWIRRNGWLTSSPGHRAKDRCKLRITNSSRGVAGLRISRICTIVLAIPLACGLLAQTVSPQLSLFRDDSRVTPVSGESWLIHLNRSFGDTSMGKTGRLGPGPEEKPALQSPVQGTIFSSRDGVTLHGSDLYRLNCQGCHGESGLGAPPEINSVINPVRATSVAPIMERMKTVGTDISRADAAQLAKQSNTTLLQRLHNGGQNMPPFPHLNEAEVRALVAYLKQLASVPGAEREQVAVRESSVRVGEHIVKSTCQTCHSAAGPDPSPQQLLDGEIPPLNTLTARKSRPEFIQKVTHGAPVLMGTPPLLYRGRMPVFYYLSGEEAADVYLYLTLYPPSESANPDTAVALSQQHQAAGGGTPPPQKVLSASFVRANQPVVVQQPSQGADLQTVALLSGVGLFVILLLAAGLGFTVREFKRLSAKSAGGRTTVKTMHKGRTEDATASFLRAS